MNLVAFCALLTLNKIPDKHERLQSNVAVRDDGACTNAVHSTYFQERYIRVRNMLYPCTKITLMCTENIFNSLIILSCLVSLSSSSSPVLISRYSAHVNLSASSLNLGISVCCFSTPLRSQPYKSQRTANISGIYSVTIMMIDPHDGDKVRLRNVGLSDQIFTRLIAV
jgi:hypothetical protein